mmetsp:Transcript_15333/g.17357  ORF Transcript_15333/g.17357 Transcript_15333/m.17357 type:complete len:359 (-) Transcript_15333:1712-2788(-)
MQVNNSFFLSRFQSSGVVTHGLSNYAGENNCFINSVIQVLWHLDIFRKNFERQANENENENEKDHDCTELASEADGSENDEVKSCLVCALRGLFLNFRYSNQDTLPPEYVRKALAILYEHVNRFQIGKMDSAIECYEAILKELGKHTNLTTNIFTFSVCETTVCACGASSEPFINSGYIFYVSVDEFLNLKRNRIMYNSSKGQDFGNVLKDCLQQGRNPCPDEEVTNCKKTARTQTTLLKAPRVLTLSLSWASNQAERSLVVEVMESIGTTVDLTKTFNYNMDELEGAGNIYQLAGIVAYYGRHYVAFVYHNHFKKWIYCDDSNFKTLGSWSKVVKKFKDGKWQPELLVYTSKYVDIN